MAKKALCIGINNYPGTHMDLQGCVNDASDWAAALVGRGFAAITLLNDQATKAAMMTAMGNLISKAVKNDSLVITFSGHGTYQPDTDGDEADGLDEALCPYDLQTNGAALTDDEIKTLFANRKGGVRIVLIADSCHSGTVTRAAAAEPDSDTRPRFMPMGNWLPDKLLPKNRVGKLSATVVAPLGGSPLLAAYSRQLGDPLLSGCKEGTNNFSYDARINGRYNGAFTYYALKALKTLKPEATYADWHKAFVKYLPSASYPQSPQIVGSDTARKGIVFA
ncbi:caspase family protein [Rhodoferax antarcticus]|uniref:Peptidase C14, caspase catalytic subunit p20 n=1 Tax=Rhodoferax antarcticus ANT.BR TaxID=1111071 RepID=A0A1Q8YJG0_9BURK|nr:caspase family protein [Rhodoferax antarcticus]APW47675.1 peptidase C14 [Rhodoferax antarcticus]OLP08191.1 peptidase C14, caspase catalytic subunit p20 [Rhodoferax antarcticus ANT.BR]